MDESQALNNIKDDIDVKESLDCLIKLHEGVFHKIVNSYILSDINGMTKQDIVNQKLTVFWQSSVSFDPDRGTKFVTWLGKNTFFFLSKEYDKVKHFKQSVEIIDNISPARDDFKKAEQMEIVDLILGELRKIEDERIIKIFELRYFGGTNHKLTTWKKIGEHLNLTGQACINLHEKGVEHLKYKIKHE